MGLPVSCVYCVCSDFFHLPLCCPRRMSLVSISVAVHCLSGLQGYLKISINVLGPGDEPTVIGCTSSAICDTSGVYSVTGHCAAGNTYVLCLVMCSYLRTYLPPLLPSAVSHCSPLPQHWMMKMWTLKREQAHTHTRTHTHAHTLHSPSLYSGTCSAHLE